MVDFIRRMFEKSLKTNDSLQLAILTGCLGISKESIFTGLNNFRVYTIKDVLSNEYFGLYTNTNQWFRDKMQKASQKLRNLCKAFGENNIAAIEEGFYAYLKKIISIRDTNIRKDMKENFYHGIACYKKRCRVISE